MRNFVKLPKRMFAIKVIIVVMLSLINIKVFSDSKYAIYTSSTLATEAGIDVLKKGGNAFDAAVAVSGVLSVVQPYSMSLGGGGFWLLYNNSSREYSVIDSRETAPKDARVDMFLNKSKNILKTESTTGPISSAVPGVPAAIAYINHKHGKLPLQQLLKPAIRYALNGFPVNKTYQDFVTARLDLLKSYPTSAAIFLQDNKVPELGSVIIQGDLAKTLLKIINRGKNGFYTGIVAKKLVSEVRANGGVWQLDDLQQYSIKKRLPLIGDFASAKIITTPPPSSGGVFLLTALNILKNYDFFNMSLEGRTSLLLETMKWSFLDGERYIGDPDFISALMPYLLSDKNAKVHVNSIEKSKEIKETNFKFIHDLNTNGCVANFSIMDSYGNKVSAVFSLNEPFGSGFTAGGTGVLLNNNMNNFSYHNRIPNSYGLVSKGPNLLEPHKRPITSMTPCFVENKDRTMALNISGSNKEASILLLTILDIINKNSFVNLTSPRFNYNNYHDVVEYESESFTSLVVNMLQKNGYNLKQTNKSIGQVNVVDFNKKNKKFTAVADPRDYDSSVAIG